MSKAKHNELPTVAPAQNVATVEASPQILTAIVEVGYQPTISEPSGQDDLVRLDLGRVERDVMAKIKAMRRKYVSMDERRQNGKQVQTNADAVLKLLEDLPI